MATPVETILYASYVSPFPTNSGERIRAVNLIKALRSLGYAVEAIVGNADGADLAAHNSDGIRFYQIPFAWPRLRQAVSVYVKPQADFIRQVLALHGRRPLKAILLDYGYLGAQISALGEIGVPIILGTHNVESAVTGQAPKTTLARGAGLFLRQAVEAVHERWFFRKADAVICVSEEDRRVYARYLPPDRIHVVPNFADIPDAYQDAPRQDRIIMSGSFDNFQNMDGLGWFIDEVWDDELRAATQFCIAGKQSDRAAREFSTVPGLFGLGARGDLLAEIAASRCAIVPLRQGGGTRFKCLEAMAVRTPLVSTAKGCEGILHDGTMHVADTPQAFKAAILDVLAHPARAAEQAARARAVYDRRYSLAANAECLDQVIASAVKTGMRRLF
jgi:glycosyltransferase involved in cell wall biosynthesis